jgi:hypothetical protein
MRRPSSRRRALASLSGAGLAGKFASSRRKAAAAAGVDAAVAAAAATGEVDASIVVKRGTGPMADLIRFAFWFQHNTIF